MNTFSKSVIGALVCGAVGIVVFPMFADAKESSGPMPGSQFLAQMGRGLLVYAEANGMKLPPADVWRDRIDPYVDANRLGKVKPDLAFHTRMGGADLSELDAPSQIGMLFTTSEIERNAHDNFESVVYRMKGVYAGIVRADGRVSFLRRDELDLMRSNSKK